LVYAHQKTLHPKLEVIAEGEEENVFVCDKDGIWFDGINKTKTGRILANQQTDKSRLSTLSSLNVSSILFQKNVVEVFSHPFPKSTNLQPLSWTKLLLSLLNIPGQQTKIPQSKHNLSPFNSNL
jgi:hypothetical protein